MPSFFTTRGERRYQQLVDKANRYHLATDDYHELTQGFLRSSPLASPADQHTVAASKDQLGQPSEPRVTAPNQALTGNSWPTRFRPRD